MTLGPSTESRRPGRALGRRLSSFFHRHPRVSLGALLAAPLGWLLIGYLGSLSVLLMAAFWDTDVVHGRDRPHVHARQLPSGSSSRTSTATWPGARSRWPRSSRSPCAVLAFPIAYYMARVASRRTRDILVVAVLTPLWAELPRKGVRLADDPLRQRRHQLAARAVRAPVRRLLDGRPLARRSRTSGCRS